MAISSSALVQRVRDLLGDRPLQDTSSTTGTGSTVVVADTTLYSPGRVVEWQTGTVGYEQFYVKSITNATDMVVVRGYNGTTAEAHTNGDAIIIEPSFTGRTIQQAITAVLNDSWPYAWTVGTVSLTYSNSTAWYDLHASTMGIVSVMQKKQGTVADFGKFRDRYVGDNLSYIVHRNLPSTIVTSGNGIHFPQGVYDARTSGGNPMIVTDARVITGTSDIEDSGSLPIAEAMVWGVAGRLLRAKEIPRVTAGEPLTTTSSVGTGARFRLGQEYEQEWRRRLEYIKVRLQAVYDPDDLWVA